MRTGYTTEFYPYMFRNLSIFRDIAKLIFEARQRQRKTIIFRDERGDTWQLVRVGDEPPSRYSSPHTRTEESRSFNDGHGIRDNDCMGSR